MDERVDHSESRVESPPLSRVTTPVRRSRWRGAIILIGVIVLGLALGWWLWPKHAAQPAGGNPPAKGAQTAPQPVGAATIDTGDIRIIPLSDDAQFAEFCERPEDFAESANGFSPYLW